MKAATANNKVSNNQPAVEECTNKSTITAGSAGQRQSYAAKDPVRGTRQEEPALPVRIQVNLPLRIH